MSVVADTARVRALVDSVNDPEAVVNPKRAVAQNELIAVHSHLVSAPQPVPGAAAVDIFALDDAGEIVEHWGVVQELAAPNASGNDMVSGGGDGEAAVAAADVEANKRAVARLFDAFRAGDTNAFDALISAEQYIQHNPQAANGLAAMKGFFQAIGPVDVDLTRVMGSGDLVFAQVRYAGLGTDAVDIFRFDTGGKIVEHWDVHQRRGEATP